MKKLTCLTTLAAVLAITGLPLRAAAGDDKSAPNFTGTWKLTHSSTNTQARPAEYTLKLKLNGSALTGTLGNVSKVNGKSQPHEWAITEAKVQGNEIFFTVTHPPVAGNGPDSTTTYKGEISGDIIKGTCELEWMGETHTRGWEAKRVIAPNSP